MQNISPSKKQLLNMYYMMHKIRLFEEKLIELHPEQMMKCLQHYCIGQEAITTGVNSILNKGDKVLCSYRSHGHFIAKGGDINKLMIELHLKKDGISSTVVSMHTLKPFDEDTFIDSIQNAKVLITLEEHSINGGLGEKCASIISQKNIHISFKIKSIFIFLFPHSFFVFTSLNI